MKYYTISIILSVSTLLYLGNARTSEAQTTCEPPSTWISHAVVPPPDNNTAPSSNCAFHVWAWNTFLWITQPVEEGALRFKAFATLDDLFSSTASAMRFSALPKEKVLKLTVRVNKSFEMQGLDSIFQAGRRGVLIHGPGTDSGRAVYYSQNVDPVFYEFVRTNKYYLPDEYEKAQATVNFPVGAMEFKYSWKVVKEGEDTSTFYVTKAEIFLLTETTDSTGKTTVVVDPSKTKTVDVALVGVHVVGVVKDHPEFIWATFEHKDNAPDLPAGMSMTAAEPVSDRDWTFYHKNTPASDSNRNPADNPTSPMKLVDADKQLLSPVVNIYRAFPFGGGTPENIANIRSLNESVQTKVLAGSVWANYMLVGGVWSKPNNVSPGAVIVPQLGSVSLANTTMETFDQLFPNVNCFACHKTTEEPADGITIPAKNMNLSHIMTNGYFRQRVAGK
ncbi:hypothetical protein HFN49_31800 [Rhizobium leguminosarum]|uniref:hypothetical protein n=1 Tax=Rhizobium ruizarguesonis TaxID=2081791 RepID=UPI001A9892E3|nr:hypothetical protein [Rhizobium ruizarguesonis]MBY5890760.1 hypothetical protein [Rhizobium leguminosarum]QSZ05124.1 hypothetical protein J3P73_31440 [Rhizobium ruizarguesonis]